MKTLLSLCFALALLPSALIAEAPDFETVTFTAKVSQVTPSALLVYEVYDSGGRADEPYLVYGHWPGLIDGAERSFTVYPAGNAQYTSVMGATRTVRAFSESHPRDLALAGAVFRHTEDTAAGPGLTLLIALGLTVFLAVILMAGLAGKKKKQEY